MMKFHKPGRLRMLGGAAAVATLGGLSLAFGSAGAIAQPAPPAPPAPPSSSAPRDGNAERREERVIVRTYRNDEHGDRHGDGARSERHGQSGDREERRVMVITSHHGDGERHTEHSMDMRDGDGHAIMMTECGDGDRQEFNEGNDSNRTRVIICNRGQRTPAQRVEALQRARDNLARDEHMSADTRTRVLAALDAQIARMRAGQ